jgi:Mn2+/Fe2+ NRAMP family transporter
MALLMPMASGRKIMGEFIVSPLWQVLGWLATLVMAAAAAAFLATLFT